MIHQRHLLEAEVHSSFLLVSNYSHFYFVTPKEGVFAVALSLEVFVSLIQVGQTHSSHYYLGIYLYFFQLQYRFFHLLVPVMLLERLGDY